MEHDTVLAGDGLRLRPFRAGDPADLAFLVLIADDPTSRQWSRSLRSIHDVDSAKAWLNRRAGDDASREWMVEDAESGSPLGRVGLHRFDPDDALEVGYWTLPTARGRGVARRAARLVARHAHVELGERRVALVHAVANPASCRVALASSFAVEGTHRAALDHGDGVKWDMHTHARLAEDPWDPIPPAVPAGGPPRLAGDGLVLRPWSTSDADALRTASTDDLIRRWNPFAASTDDDVVRYVERMSYGVDNLGWAILHPDAGAVLGYVSLHRISTANACGEAGYWVMPGARGSGVAGRALDVMARFAGDTLGLERVELFHAVENRGSCRVAVKAGFALECVRRKGYRYPDGLLHDEHLHARITGA